jgi:hypothetical protein
VPKDFLRLTEVNKVGWGGRERPKKGGRLNQVLFCLADVAGPPPNSERINQNSKAFQAICAGSGANGGRKGTLQPSIAAK